MITRYQSPDIETIFSPAQRFSIFIEIEALLLEELSHKHNIRRHEIKSLRELKQHIDVRAIERQEDKTRHEITAFLNWIWIKLPRASGIHRYLHLGLTSSDLMDTALSFQTVSAIDVILGELEKTLSLLNTLSLRHKTLLTIGRTHGIYAEPTTMGLKFLGFLQEGKRNKKRLLEARKTMAYGKLSGSVGNFASSLIDPKTEEKILGRLGLKAEPVATQIIPRDRHAELLCQLGVLAGWIERLATEIRHLQRTEVSELAEPFGEAQQGSSSMPHKRNPVLCENLCGLARILRGFSITALENISLWHERDISHSSAERVIVPDAFSLSHFMLKRLNYVLSGIEVNAAKVRGNAKALLDLPYSQSYLNDLILSGISRKEAYKIIQQASFAALKQSSSLWSELKKTKGLEKASLWKASEKILLAKVDGLFKRAKQNL